MDLKNKIFDCIKEHVGGEKFFDALDALLRTDSLFGFSILTVALNKPSFLDENEEFNPVVILSGKFAQAYGDIYEEDGVDVIRLEGALRFNEINNQEQYKSIIKDRYCVFIDDSYFAGTTYSRVKEMVKKCGGICTGAFVGYDGSKLLNPEVISFFRYYDHFGHEKS